MMFWHSLIRRYRGLVLVAALFACESSHTGVYVTPFDNYPAYYGDGPVTRLALGDSLPMRAAVYEDVCTPYDKYSSLERPDDFHWHSSDTNVVAVAPNGRLYARKIGEVTISATATEIGMRSLGVVVRVEPTAYALSITPPALSVSLGDTARVTVAALDSLGRSVTGVAVTVAMSGYSVATGGPIAIALGSSGIRRTPFVFGIVPRDTGRVDIEAAHQLQGFERRYVRATATVSVHR